MRAINKGTTHVVIDAAMVGAGKFLSQHKTQASAEKNAARISSMCKRVEELNKVSAGARTLLVLPVAEIAKVSP